MGPQKKKRLESHWSQAQWSQAQWSQAQWLQAQWRPKATQWGPKAQETTQANQKCRPRQRTTGIYSLSFPKLLGKVFWMISDTADNGQTTSGHHTLVRASQ